MSLLFPVDYSPQRNNLPLEPCRFRGDDLDENLGLRRMTPTADDANDGKIFRNKTLTGSPLVQRSRIFLVFEIPNFSTALYVFEQQN